MMEQRYICNYKEARNTKTPLEIPYTGLKTITYQYGIGNYVDADEQALFICNLCHNYIATSFPADDLVASDVSARSISDAPPEFRYVIDVFVTYSIWKEKAEEEAKQFLEDFSKFLSRALEQLEKN